MIKSFHVDTVDDLPELTEDEKGSYANVGKGWLQKRYIFVWITPRDREPYGQWQFACFLERD